MNQCSPGSQEARGELNTGPSEPLEVVLLVWKIVQPSFLRCFAYTSRRGPSDAAGSGLPRVRGWSGWVTDWGGLKEWDGEIGAGLSVGRGEGCKPG